MSSTDFYFPGSVGLLAAVLFVSVELLLLPLFEQARERLTATFLRHRISNGNSVWLGYENKLTQWLGISDGVYKAGGRLVLPRLLKTLLKLSLFVSCFIFEFYIEPVKVTTNVTYHFNGGGAYVISSIPVDGGRYWDETRYEESEKVSNSYQGLTFDLELFSWCTSSTSNLSAVERIVYFGIFTTPDGNLICLNGTEGRDQRIAFKYNPDSNTTIYSEISSIELKPPKARDRLTYQYPAEVILQGSSDVHSGYVGLWILPHRLKRRWMMYGLFFHNKRGTILRFYFNSVYVNGLICNNTKPHIPSNEKWLGNWTIRGNMVECPDRSHNHKGEFFGRGPIQDINLRLEKRDDEFVHAAPLDILQSWMINTQISFKGVSYPFAEEIRRSIASDVFFSGAKNDTIEFQTGPTVNNSKIARIPTIALFVSVSALLVYCVASFIIDWRSKRFTGIYSNIVSRDACVRMLHDEAVARGHIQEGQKIRLPVIKRLNVHARIRLAVDSRIMANNVETEYPS